MMFENVQEIFGVSSIDFHVLVMSAAELGTLGTG